MNNYQKYAPFDTLVGLTLKTVEGMEDGNDRIVFETSCGRKFIMYHQRECCESVSLESVVGDVQDLIGSPILLAEESSENCKDCSESGTWTFYKLATIRGYVDLRWLGESNGYYSESVDFMEISNG